MIVILLYIPSNILYTNAFLELKLDKSNNSKLEQLQNILYIPCTLSVLKEDNFKEVRLDQFRNI